MIINMNGAKAPETPSPVLQEKTVTPETLPTVIGADEGYDGLSQVTVNPDAQLKAENIRSGKSIFGVSGTFEGEPIPTEVDSVYAAYLGNYYLSGSGSVSLSTTNMVTSTPGDSLVSASVDRPSNDGTRLLRGNRFTFVNDKIPNVFSGSLYESGYPITITADAVNITQFTFRPDNYQDITYKAGTPVNGTLVGGLGMRGTGRYFLGFSDKDVTDSITYEFSGTLKWDIKANQPPNMVEFVVELNPQIVIENVSITGYFKNLSLSNDWYPGLEFYITKLTAVIG